MSFAATPAGGLVMDIVVSDHAVDRACERRHWATLTRGEVAGRISFEVQQAFENGRVSRLVPVWAVRFRLRELRGGKPRCGHLGVSTRFVFDEEERHGWIVRLREDGLVVVVTSLQRVRSTGSEVAA